MDNFITVLENVFNFVVFFLPFSITFSFVLLVYAAVRYVIAFMVPREKKLQKSARIFVGKIF